MKRMMILTALKQRLNRGLRQIESNTVILLTAE